MNPERYNQIDRLVQAAVDLPDDQRTAYLDSACGADAELRGEVETLIVYQQQASRFLEAPALQHAAEWMTGNSDEFLVGRAIGNYQIERKLGAGGMGEVYLAQDTKLDRKVAIKFLPQDIAADEMARKRLVREARAAAKLDHPNICAVHEVNEEGALAFIVMQYVEGETLANRIQRQPLELKASIDIAVQVAEALAEAHACRIIHRDIKPQNIILTPRGQVKVLDFGLAKALREPATFENEAETPSRLTDSGVIVGTVPYMSPEQVQGESLDGRSDIFSFGAVLYEMITGRRPFAGENGAAIISAILMQEPAPLRRYVAECPEELQRIVSQSLEKDRERRYQTMRDVALDLDNCRREMDAGRATASPRVPQSGSPVAATTAFDVKRHRFFLSRRALIAIAALLVMLGAALAYVLTFRKTSTAVLPPEIKSLAVLPLENFSGDPSQEYFADGMTEAIIGNLAKIRALRVVSRPSVMRFKGSRKSLPEIAQELKVDAVIVGSVQRANGRVKITAQLIQAATDTHLWANDYEGDLSDVLKLQSEVARNVAAEIRIQVTADERTRLAAARSINPQAHEAYLLGRSHLSRNNEQDYQQAIAYFERATQLAPDYAAAYAGLSDAWLQRSVFGVKSLKEVEAPARAAALQALKPNEQLAEGHISLANLKFYYDWDWTGSEAAFKRALELDPGSLDVHRSYGHLLMCLGRHDEAVKEGQIAEQLDPLSSATQTALGRFLYRARRYEEALPHLQRAVEMEPQSTAAHFRLGDVYVQLGRYAEALTVFEKGRELTRVDISFKPGIARVYALMGRQREARQMLSGVKAPPILAAAVYAALGDKDEAFGILAQAIDERSSLLVTLKEDPPLDNLHSDPRWKDLLRRMNFPPE